MTTMTNKKLKATINKAVKNMVKELSITEKPTVKVEHGNVDYVMATGGKTYYQGFLFNKTVIRTESDYILHINRDALERTFKRYVLTFGNIKAGYDYVYLIVCHEMRHMWQYEGDFFVGTKESFNLDEVLYGHGSNPAEKDANNFMIDKAKKLGLYNLACFMELEQRSCPLNDFNSEYKTEIYNTYKNTLKQYNTLYYYFIKLFR